MPSSRVGVGGRESSSPMSAARWRAGLIAVAVLATAATAVADAGEIVFPGVGDRGIFDAALERERRSRRIWMSYSAVEQVTVGGIPIDHVGTRLAVSQDRGETWADQGVFVNSAQEESQPPAGFGTAPAVWQHEVSRVVYDRGAPESERWKIFWHRYLHVDDGNLMTDDRKFQHGWIGLRTAAEPAALALAPERKLFSAAAYHVAPGIAAYNDAILGPPEVRGHQLDPSLADCLAFTEPGATSTFRGLYVSLVCGTADPAARRIVLLRWPYPAGPWEYLGVALDAASAAAINAGYTGFSASELFSRGRRVFLIASPTASPFDFYAGCLVFRLQSPHQATLRDRDADGSPDVLLTVAGDPGGFSGACGYSPRSRESGLILGRALLADPVRYHLIKTGLSP